MECLNEQNLEWGKDEMRLLGFAVTNKARLFTVPYRSLGSYGDDDVRPPGVFPLTLIDAELEDDGDQVLFYLWLVEEDGGGVRDSAAALDAEFRQEFAAASADLEFSHFPPASLPFAALYKAVLSFDEKVHEAGTAGRNDEVYFGMDNYLRFEPQGTAAFRSQGEMTFRRSKQLGDYLITFQWAYEKIPVVFS
jgi:hypothetical protein